VLRRTFIMKFFEIFFVLRRSFIKKFFEILFVLHRSFMIFFEIIFLLRSRFIMKFFEILFMLSFIWCPGWRRGLWWYCVRLPPRRLEHMGREIESRQDTWRKLLKKLHWEILDLKLISLDFEQKCVF
jgi:hypothetical protein